MTKRSPLTIFVSHAGHLELLPKLTKFYFVFLFYIYFKFYFMDESCLKSSVCKDRIKNFSYIPAYRATRKCTLNGETHSQQKLLLPPVPAREAGKRPVCRRGVPGGSPRTHASAGESAPGAQGHTGPVTYSVVREKPEITGPVSEERNIQRERKPSCESRQE